MDAVLMDFLRVRTGVEIESTKAELAAHPELWGEFGARKDGDSPHREMVDIWARYRAQDELTSTASFGEPHLSSWYQAVNLLPSIKRASLDLMALVRGEILGGVLITKLPPGGRLYRHVDRGWHAGFYEKFYVAIQNRHGSRFCWDSGTINAQEGDIWWFRNDVAHWVENDSDCDRISMIVCIRCDRPTPS